MKTRMELIQEAELAKPIPKTRTALQLERIKGAVQVEQEGRLKAFQGSEALPRDSKALQPVPSGTKRSKYKAVKTTVDGITFDSKAEAERYKVLKARALAGEIRELKLQHCFELEVNGVKICSYKADFVYIENNKYVVEDVKGFRTPVYNLKKKLMKALHGIDILEIKNGSVVERKSRIKTTSRPRARTE